ncbi:juvenile hormone esterase [Zeugodacus cucurbitae]|uniref:Carboxylic ester hydrolase n=1 Tax=Zeugodacus cucurbitae TaxID=28588 RepID=A0A0A1WI66_ZEUCU|nr:juvenile hormone esterase [Zeugodacus cucurbitae]
MLRRVYMLLCCCLLLFVPLAHSQAISSTEAPVIETSLGKIRGNVLISRKGRNIYSYRGIYYAKPPIGLRRFAAPEPVEAWNDTIDALDDGPSCPQDSIFRPMDENCLSLNVFTINVTASNPVVVYIHGGANVMGTASTKYSGSPQNLLDADIVMVGVNFRLDAFGFLSMGTPEANGNFGYFDQVLALKWVQEHIRNFGGDPTRVTLLGMSAGSMAISLHLASPLSKGLFHGVIAISGSATNHYDIDNVYLTQHLADQLGCPRYNTKYLLNCLRKFSWEELINTSAKYEKYGLINVKWNYEIDGVFLLEHPTEAIRNNRFNRVPLIVGLYRDELDFDPYKIENRTDLFDDINENFGLYVSDFFEFKSSGNNDTRAQKIREFYYNTTSISTSNLETFGRIQSDSVIGHGVHRLVELAKNHTDVYFYRFDYVGDKSLYLDHFGKPRGTGHTDGFLYIIPSDLYKVDENSPDIFMIDRLVNMFSEFAANGKPPLIENITWIPATANETVVLYMDKQPYMGGAFYQDRYALWDELFPLKENSAGIRLPVVVLLFFTIVWNVLL